MSLNIDSSLWRLRTAGGIPYKLMEGYPKGNVGEGTGVQEQLIIEATQLRAFVNESFPPAILTGWGYWAFFNNRACPRFPLQFTKNISFEPYPKDKPGDPTELDPTAPEGTYSRFLLLTIDYAPAKTNPNKDDDRNDEPQTYVEYSCDASGEFLMLPSNGAQARWGPSVGDAALEQPMRIPKIIPTLDWSVKYPRVNRVVFFSLMDRVVAKLGKVNNAVLLYLNNAAAETVLFAGFSIRAQYNFTDTVESGELSLDMKFLQKPVDDGNGVIVGHNHHFRPETGKWERLMINGQPTYQTTDLSELF